VAPCAGDAAVSGTVVAARSLLALPLVALGDAVSALELGDAVAALELGDAVAALVLGNAVSALALGAVVSLPVAGNVLAAEAVSSPAPFATEASAAGEVEGGTLLDAVGAVSTALLLDLAFEDFGAFFGRLWGSLLAAWEDEGAMAGAGATSEREPASAITEEDVWLAAALVSLAGEGNEARDSLTLATVFGAAVPDVPTWWLNASAPATTMAMITPNAMGKCFTEASCRDGQSPSDTTGVLRLRSKAQNRTATTRRFRNSHASAGIAE
jgi:hypothetical protein